MQDIKFSSRQITRARRGARALFSNSLQVAAGDQVLLVTDEDHVHELQLLSEVAHRLRVGLTSVVIPLKHQKRIRGKSQIPNILRDALHHCNGLVVLSEYSASTTPFRLSVLGYFTDHTFRGRAASMPGVTLSEFHYIGVDNKEIDQLANDIGQILFRANQVNLTTYDETGSAHPLTFSIAGTFPAMCGSVIEEGDWDNVPTGEVFTLPLRNSASGSVAISGSIPELVLEGRASAILEIDKGKITKVRSADPEVRMHTENLFFKDVERGKLVARNANVLSEFGIGVNRAIKNLHGLPIFDEKMLGTIHVAFGRNDQIGGQIPGRTHHDLVAVKPSVKLDCLEEPLIYRGRYAINDEMLELDWTRIDPTVDSDMYLERTGLHTSYEPKGGSLVVEWHQCCGPPAATRVGNYESSILAGAAYRLLKGRRQVGGFLKTMKKNGFSKDAAVSAIKMLRYYRLVRLTGKGKK